MPDPNKIDIIVSLIYRRNSLANVIGDLNRVRVTAGLLHQTVGRLGGAFMTLGRQIATAIGFYVKFRIFSLIYRAVNALTDAIPDLIARGEEWARTLYQIQAVTGMTAEETSKLAGVAKLLGLDVEHLSRDMAYLGRNAIENEEAFKRFGITIRGANGELKSTWEVFNDVRRAVSEYGRSFLSAAVAQRIFSEGGRDLLQLLQLTGPQFKALITQARQAGLIMTQAGINAAKAWERAKSLLDATITGLGAKILGGVAPILEALTVSIAGTIQKNMNSIVEFVQRVIVVVAGFISGLFGLEIQLKPVLSALSQMTRQTDRGRGANIRFGKGADDAAKSTERQRNAIERHIDALDKQLRKLDRVEDKERARREYKALLKDIADARKDLSALRNETIFFSGMSAVEAELARQSQTADIIDAEKALADAKKELREWERQQEIDAERDRLNRLRDALQERLGDLTAGTTKAVEAITKGFQKFPQAIKGLKGSVTELSDDLKELFAGASQHGMNFQKVLQLIQKGLQEMQKALMGVQQFLQFLQGPLQLIQAGLQLFQTALQEVQKFLQTLLELFYELGLVPRPKAPKHLDEFLYGPGKGTSGKESPFIAEGLESTFPRARWAARTYAGQGVQQGLPQRMPSTAERNAIFGTPHIRERMNAMPGGDLGSLPLFTEGASGGAGGGKRQRPQDEELRLDKVFRRYLGRSSDQYKSQKEQLAELGSIIGNTDPLTSGELGVTGKINRWEAGELGVGNSRFGDIGKVDRWQAGTLDVFHPKYGDIGKVWEFHPRVGVDNDKFGLVDRFTADPAVRVRNDKFSDIGAVDRVDGGVQIGVKHDKFWDIGKVDRWGVPRGIDTNVGNTVDTSVGNRVDTNIVGQSLGQITSKITGWATRAEANVEVTGPPSMLQAMTMLENFIKNREKYGAKGASVPAHVPYIVGEEGPELFTPDRAGTIYSNPETRRFLSGGGASGGTSVGTAMNVTIQLDPYTTRLLLSGRAVNSSTRAGVGT